MRTLRRVIVATATSKAIDAAVRDNGLTPPVPVSPPVSKVDEHRKTMVEPVRYERPYVGKVVHYVLAGGEHRAALITRLVKENGVDVTALVVFLDMYTDVQLCGGAEASRGTMTRFNVHRDEGRSIAGTWHQIEDVEALDEKGMPY